MPPGILPLLPGVFLLAVGIGSECVGLPPPLLADEAGFLAGAPCDVDVVLVPPVGAVDVVLVPPVGAFDIVEPFIDGAGPLPGGVGPLPGGVELFRVDAEPPLIGAMLLFCTPLVLPFSVSVPRSFLVVTPGGIPLSSPFP